MSNALRMAVYGLFLGYALSRMGFTDFDEVGAMFTLSDPRLLLTFGAAVFLTGLGFVVVLKERIASAPITRDLVVGSVLFGLGWALTGACPGAVLAQLGEGRFMAFWTLAGVLGGSRSASWYAARKSVVSTEPLPAFDPSLFQSQVSE